MTTDAKRSPSEIAQVVRILCEHARLDALEEAARACDSIALQHSVVGNSDAAWHTGVAAKAIRRLK